MKTGIFAMLAASLFAAQVGCHSGKNDVQGPKPDDDKDDPVTQDQRASCDQEIALECPEGQVDGCSNSLTAVHICLPAEETASQPCEQEIARQCAEGLVDACLMDPPAAETHVCVSAMEENEPSDPEPTDPEPTDPEPQPESTEG